MTNLPLEPGDELRCLHCGQFHPLTAWHTEGSPYTLTMLHWEVREEDVFRGTPRERQPASDAVASARERPVRHGSAGELIGCRVQYSTLKHLREA